MKLLECIDRPSYIKNLSTDMLKQLAEEIRERIIEVVGRNGGHLASNLGVTEITIALHYCFDFEHDRLLWDVGHQCYAHKLLTGRNEDFDTLRQTGGLSGFPNFEESPYDLFKVGHAGTSIATAVGLAQADQTMGHDAKVVAFVGDASIVNGLSFEGLNQAGLLNRQLLVILNDNSWGIAPAQGALAEHLAKFRASSIYEDVKLRVKRLLPKVPLLGKSMFEALEHLKEGIKATVSPHQIFEQMGFMYIGPIEGHDIAHLIDLLKLLREVHHPVLLHIHTTKGQGAEFAVAEPERFHSPKPFEVNGNQATIKNVPGKSWTSAFADALIEVAKEEPHLVAITAGMPDGTGLNKFAEVYPDRCRDVGIAESCAVDMAAGMAKGGLKPVVAIYSTFIQRAFDQIYQEVTLQGLPVILCMDRAGLVGGDGAVHHGHLDISFLRGFAHIILLAPADENELRQALRFAIKQKQACAIRYPRDNVPKPFGQAPPFVLGKSRLLKKGEDATILAYGTTVESAMDAAELLSVNNIDVKVVNARFAKPIDINMVVEALADNCPVLTVEDHCVVGGFGSAVLETAHELGLPTEKLIMIGIPADRFIQHGSRTGQLAECGIDAAGIAATVQQALGRPAAKTAKISAAGMVNVRPDKSTNNSPTIKPLRAK
ncbi:MAG: 1-deoxy-D-xylulose-5-phosphate synthase, partial [Planctomycetota bacterium]